MPRETCDYEISNEELPERLEGWRCGREVWTNVDEENLTKCIWHTQQEEKAADDLITALQAERKKNEPWAQRFDGAWLQGVDFREQEIVSFVDCTFVRADLSSVYLDEAILSGVHFNGANLQGAHLNGAKLQGAHFFVIKEGKAELPGLYLWFGLATTGGQEGATLLTEFTWDGVITALQFSIATFGFGSTGPIEPLGYSRIVVIIQSMLGGFLFALSMSSSAGSSRLSPPVNSHLSFGDQLISC